MTIELKNDIQIRGTLKSVDQYLNIKLDDISVVEELKYPHLVSCADPTPIPITATRDGYDRNLSKSTRRDWRSEGRLEKRKPNADST